MKAVIKDGVEWRPFVMGYKTDEGNFTSIFYAVSPEHARLIIQDIRDTVELVGEVVLP
jgi:hypothetical protein